jgi:uncharacterized protein (DUF58 family)
MIALRGATPTARTALILAAIAVAALFVPVALAAAAALVLAAFAFADAWTVRVAPGAVRRAPAMLSRGVPVALEVDLVARDRTVLLRQPATPELQIAGGRGADRLRAELCGRRRGRHTLPGLASASVGPLGLARVGHPQREAQEIAVYPDVVGARALLARRRRALAGNPGRLARGPLGLGTDFESVREYTPDDDIRQLNWTATARLGRPMSNQYRLERDRELTCLIDCGRLMSAPLGEQTMLDAMLDAVTVLALAADELGDRCGALAFDAEVRRAVTPGRRGGRQVVDALFDLQPRPVDTDFEAAFIRVGRARRGLIVVFTDLVDEAAARSLRTGVPMLAPRHEVIVASATDPVLADAADRGTRDDAGALERAAARVAADVLDTRAAVAQGLRRAGATVLEAPAAQLPARCLEAYLRLKSRGRA